jgi:hypothetical protein
MHMRGKALLLWVRVVVIFSLGIDVLAPDSGRWTCSMAMLLNTYVFAVCSPVSDSCEHGIH